MPDSPDNKSRSLGRRRSSAPDNPVRKNYLLSIGIDHYKYVSKLDNAVRDAKAVTHVLQDRYNFDPQWTIELYNEEATRENIIAALDKLAESIDEGNDNLLIYYAGHGYYRARRKIGYWVPVNARDGKFSDFIYHSAIKDHIGAIPAHHLLMIVDSCFSGNLLRNRGRGNSPTVIHANKVDQFPSRWCIAAGMIEKVSDGYIGDHSPFAKSLITYLEKNIEPRFPVQDLITHVSKATSYNADQTPIGGVILKVGDQNGQFVFDLKSDYWKEAQVYESTPTGKTPWEEWQEVAKTPTLESVKAFMDKYPEGLYHKLALRLYETLQDYALWEEVNLEGTLEAYKKYLDSFSDPEGANFFREARRKIRKLVDKQLLKADDLASKEQFEQAISVWEYVIAYVQEAEKARVESLLIKARENLQIRIQKEKEEKERKRKISSYKAQATKWLKSAKDLFDRKDYMATIQKIETAISKRKEALAIALDDEKPQLEVLISQATLEKERVTKEEARVTKLRKRISAGEELLQNRDFDGAKNAWVKALSTATKEEKVEIAEKIQLAQQEQDRSTNLESHLAKCRVNLENYRFEEALLQGNNALKLANENEKDEVESLIQLVLTEQKRIQNQQAAIEKGDEYLENDELDSALKAYEEALAFAIAKEQKDLQSEIEEIKKLIQKREEAIRKEEDRSKKLTSLKQKGEDFFSKDAFGKAIQSWNNALQYARDAEIEELKKHVQLAKNKQQLQNKLNQALAEAETNYSKGEYEKAISAWNRALKLAEEDKRGEIQQNIDKAKTGLEAVQKEQKRKQQLKALKAKAWKQYQNMQLALAIESYQKALTIANKSEAASIQDQIDFVKSKIEEQKQENERKEKLTKLIAEGESRLKNNRYNLAIESWEEALTLALDNEITGIENYIKNAREEIDKIKQAEAAAKKEEEQRRIQRDKNMRKAKAEGDSYYLNKRYQAAIASWQKALQFANTSDKKNLRNLINKAKIEQQNKGLALDTDEKAWMRARVANDRFAFMDYLDAFPKGQFVKEARKELKRWGNDPLTQDGLDWRQAKLKGTSSSILDYIEKFPDGKFLDEALKELGRIERKKTSQTTKLNSPPSGQASGSDRKSSSSNKKGPYHLKTYLNVIYFSGSRQIKGEFYVYDHKFEFKVVSNSPKVNPNIAFKDIVEITKEGSKNPSIMIDTLSTKKVKSPYIFKFGNTKGDILKELKKFAGKN